MEEFVFNNEDFTIIEEIRSGGFGKITKVKNNKTGQIYAAKNINAKGKKLVDDKMIKQELEVFMKVKGPGILPFYGFSYHNNEGENYPIIYTEFMENGSLGELLRKELAGMHNAKWDNTLKMINIYGIAKTMSFLHRNFVVHKDLKPDNILLDNNYYPFISDFGMSVFSNAEIKSSLSGGTPIFMAPEIYLNNPIDSKVDVYSFAMLTYEIIVGKEPFRELKNNLFVLWHRILSGARPTIPSTVPECFRQIITKSWNKDPSQRPTFDDIVNEIDNGTLMLDNVDIQKLNDYKKTLI